MNKNGTSNTAATQVREALATRPQEITLEQTATLLAEARELLAFGGADHHGFGEVHIDAIEKLLSRAADGVINARFED